MANATGATIEDLVLYLCGSVLRCFLMGYNALPDRALVAAMFGLRADGRSIDGDNVYNAIDLYGLGTDWADPHKRLAAIRRSVQAPQAPLQTRIRGFGCRPTRWASPRRCCWAG